MRRLVLGLAAVAVCVSACSNGPAPHLSTGPLRLSTTTEAPPATPVAGTPSTTPTTTPQATTTTHPSTRRPTTTRPKPKPTTKSTAPPPVVPPPVGPPPAAPTSPAPVVPDQAMLSTALLTASDLPGQFGVAPPPSGVGDSSLSGCPTLSSDPAGATATASVALTDATDGAGVTEILMQFPAESATKAMASFAALPTTCPTVTLNLDGTPVTFTTAPLPVPSLGDASTATRMTAPLPSLGVTLYEDVVAVRHTNTMVFVLVTGLSNDMSLTTTATRTAFDRVAARW